jgi:hypothetical protein
VVGGEVRWPNVTPERRAEIEENARQGRRRQANDRWIDQVVERAGQLSPQQVERLRSLLPEPDPDGQTAKT